MEKNKHLLMADKYTAVPVELLNYFKLYGSGDLSINKLYEEIEKTLTYHTNIVRRKIEDPDFVDAPSGQIQYSLNVINFILQFKYGGVFNLNSKGELEVDETLYAERKAAALRTKKDIGSMASYMYSITGQSLPELQNLMKLLSEKNELRAKKLLEIQNEHKKVLKKLKEAHGISSSLLDIKTLRGKYGEEITSFMWEKDELGNYTGKFISLPELHALNKLETNQALVEARLEYYEFVTNSLRNIFTQINSILVKQKKPTIMYPENFAPIIPKDSWIQSLRVVLPENQVKLAEIEYFDDKSITLPYRHLLEEGDFNKNVAEVFDIFMQRAVHKLYYEPALDIFKSYKLYIENMLKANGEVSRNAVTFIENITKMQILENAQFEVEHLTTESGTLDDSNLLPDTSTQTNYMIKRSVDVIKSITALNALGFNTNSALVNFMTGAGITTLEGAAQKFALSLSKGLKEVAGGSDYRDFTLEGLRKASLIVGKELSEWYLNGKPSKVYELAKYFGVNMDRQRISAALDSNLTNKLNLGIAYIFQHTADMLTQPTLMVAMMMHDNTWNDYDIDENGKLIYVGYGSGFPEPADPKLRGRSWDEKYRKGVVLNSYFNSDMPGVNILHKFGMKTVEVTRIKRLMTKIHGAGRQDTKVAGEVFTLAQLALLFRRWVLPIIEDYWNPAYLNKVDGKLVYDDKGMLMQDQFIDEGKIQTLVRVGNIFREEFRNIFKANLNPMTNKFSQLSYKQRRNLARLSLELGGMLVISIVIKGLFDDDEEREWARFTDRYLGDIVWGINPFDYTELVRNPSAAVTTIITYMSIIRDSFSGEFDQLYKGVPGGRMAVGIYDVFRN
jgi:hypothetical protein